MLSPIEPSGELPAPAPGPSVSPPPAPVLLCDDREENLVALESLLEPVTTQLDLRLVRARSGEEALRAVLREEFAVILLDVEMPGTSGPETARLIKARKQSEHIPIIFLTALEQDRRRISAAYQSGAVDYLTKPVDAEVLRNKVTAFVELHRRRHDAIVHERRRFADAASRTETALRALEQRLAGIIESAMDAIITTDDEQRVVLFNAAAERLFGIKSKDVLGSPIERLIPARYRAQHRADVETFGRTGATKRSAEHPALALALRADGTEFPIEASISQLQQGGSRLYTVILRDVTERRAVEQERARLLEAERAARAAAELAEQAKGEFLATMSHELRTPLNAIVGYVQLLEMELLGPVTPEQHEFLTRLARSGQHLLGLVNDVLDLAKADAGELTVTRDHAPVDATVDAAIALIHPQAEARRLRLTTHCAHAVPYAGDEARVRQILVNLLSNAVKFTEPGGAIEVECGRSDEVPASARLRGPGPWTVIRVRDTGIGIAPEDQRTVFQPFRQVDGRLTRTHGGTGLGLAISQRLARLMGGDLTLESVPGRGSTFALWLPASEPPATAASRGRSSASAVCLDEVTGSAGGRRMLGVAQAGAQLRGNLEGLLERFVDRLRTDSITARVAGPRSRAELEDHALSFLADVVQSLIAIEDSETQDSELFKDGSDIQRTIAELHGRQRQRLGWTVDILRREYALLREEIGAQLSCGADDRPEAPRALDVLFRLLARAEQASVRGLQQAAPSGW